MKHRWIKVTLEWALALAILLTLMFVVPDHAWGQLTSREHHAAQDFGKTKRQQWVDNKLGKTPHSVVNAYFGNDQFKYLAKKSYQVWVNHHQTKASFTSGSTDAPDDESAATLAAMCCNWPDPSTWWDNTVKTMGDGLMCAFYQANSNIDAAKCAGETMGKMVEGVSDVTVKPAFECGRNALITTVIVQRKELSPAGTVRWVSHKSFVMFDGLVAACVAIGYADMIFGDD